MRKVVAFAFVSVDGVAEAPERFFTAWDDVVDKAGDELIAPQDAVILGRRSYDEWAAYWPSSDIEPFATFINSVAKYVATSTPLAGEWSNASVIDGDLATFVRRLKEQPGGDIGVHASISVTQALLAAGVVDVLRLATAPAVVGDGRRLLEGLPTIGLELLRGLTTPSGYVVADYRIAAS
jgi:dihydrofolate reductase